MSNTNFLHTIVAPNLTDSNFGQSIQTQFENINTNFQRLVSAAYLSGQDGNDVVVNDVPIYNEKITVEDSTNNTVSIYDTIDVITEFLNVDDGDTYDSLYSILQQAVFTDFGLQLVKTIFDDVAFDFDEQHNLIIIIDNVKNTIKTNKDLEGLFLSYSDTNKYPIWLAFVYNPFVRMFAIHDIDTDTITNICATQLYYFYDARIGSIQLLDDKESANNFTDYTSFITISSERNADGDYEIDGTYTMSKSQDLPTLYYDNDAQEFCWKMNGIETNITAQGVKGNKGEPAGCWFCRGVSTSIPDENNKDSIINVKLISYYTNEIDENDNLTLRPVNNDCEIKNGDFVCVDVYNDDIMNNTTYFDTIFGNVNVSIENNGDSLTNTYTVTRPYHTSIMSMIKKSPIALYEYLKNIDGNGKNDALHGLFVPSYSSPDNIHMMNSAYIDNNDCLIIHPVSLQDAIGKLGDKNINIPTLELSTKPNLVIDGYASVEMKSSDSNLNVNVDGNVNVSQNIKCTVNGVNDVYVGTPIGTVIDYYGEIVPEGWVRIGGSTFDSMTIHVTYGATPEDYDVSITPLSNDTKMTMYLTFNDKRMINIFILLSSYGTSQYTKLPNGKYMKRLLSVFDDENQKLTNTLVKEYTGWPFSVKKSDGNYYDFHFGTFPNDNNIMHQQPNQPSVSVS